MSFLVWKVNLGEILKSKKEVPAQEFAIEKAQLFGKTGTDRSQLSNQGSIYEQAAEDIFSGADGCSVTVPRTARGRVVCRGCTSQALLL